jgi:hypothetical protein
VTERQKLLLIAVLSTAVLWTTVIKAFANPPTEAEKVEALKMAYELNGKSMTRWGSIDLSGPPPVPNVVRTIPIDPTPKKGERK